MYWGNLSCRYVKLKENMTEIDGPVVIIPKPQNYTEGPWLYKRNSLYYLVYAAKFPETIEYCTSDSPTGPWTYRGVIEDPVPNSTTTHAGIIDYKGNTYFFYHNGALPTGSNYRRSVCVDYMYYNEDGTIQKIIQTKEGVKPVK
jgi:beta-xylosidase